MNAVLLVLILAVCAIAFLMALWFFGAPTGGFGSRGGRIRSNLQNIVSSQRASTDAGPSSGRFHGSVFKTAQEASVKKKTDARLTLPKKLKYAQWPISPTVFYVFVVLISACAAVFTKSFNLNIVMVSFSLLSGPLFMHWLLNFFMDRRFAHFDSDYPAFLLSLVGLLKTGMNTLSALEAAAKGLDVGSLVRQEVELMLERLRFGVSEQKSIGAFGDDIFHPEIELFVQALLLSQKVGGNLSDTLERLAKQVRKRQYFRASAKAAVGLQRGSIWFIIAILVGLEIYLWIVYPEAVVGAWADDLGKQVWQFGILVIMLGIFWVRQVTKIRT